MPLGIVYLLEDRGMDIRQWLRGLGLESYATAFIENAVDLDTLKTLTAEDLKDLGVELVGHRRKLLNAISTLANPEIGPTDPITDTRAPSLGPEQIARGAERRQLTVMFVDLVGSTELSRQVDPEQMRDLLRDYQNTVAAEVVRYDGHIAKFMGDGVLAFFGWPIAHEDEPERAVRAGLAICAAVPLIVTQQGKKLSVRVGIATGLVVVGELIGSGASQEEAVVGETPNLAARLQAFAKPGTVVVSELTHRLLGRLFEVVEISAQEVRGYDLPVRAYCIARESTAEGRFEALRTTSRTPLAGREQELSLLLDRWQRSVSGEGQVVQLVGEPGIGKSRILEELRNQLKDQAHTRLRYFCSPYHIHTALYPIIEQLVRAAEINRNERPEQQLARLEAVLRYSTRDLDKVVPVIASLLSIPTAGAYPELNLTPQKQKACTFDVLLAQVEGLSQVSPVLMLLEDAHWLDPTSVEIFDQMVERIQRLHAMLVVTSRPEAVIRWNGYPHTTLLTLNRLSQSHAMAIIDRMAEGKTLPANVRDQILSKTEGVPLFVEELTKVVLESGLLREENGRLVLTGPLPPLAIPATLHDSLMARLDRLAPVREVAQIGAVIGREFGHELLAQVTGFPKLQIEDGVGQLVAAGLVFRRGTGNQSSYIFKHALVQDAAYNSLLVSRRQQLHARIAQMMEENFPETGAREPELLAYHCDKAGLHESAVQYYESAGRRALAQSAVTEALAHFDHALEALLKLPASRERLQRELSIQLALGSAYVAANGFAAPETGAAYTRAAELCEALGESRQLFPVLYGLLLFHLYAAQLAEAKEIAERLLNHAQTSNERTLLFFAHRAAGVSALPAGKFCEARSHLEEALTLYDESEHQTPSFIYAFDPRVVCLDYLARALLPLGFPEQALRTNDEAVATAHRIAHHNSLSLPLFFGGVLRQILGDHEGVKVRCVELARIADELGFGFWRAGSLILHGWLLAESGDVEFGRRELAQGVEAWRASGASYMVPYFLALQAQIEHRAGNTEAALGLLEMATARVDQTGERWFEAELLRLRGNYLRLSGTCVQDAKRFLHRALMIADQQKALFWQLRAARSLAEAEPDSAAECHRVAMIYGQFKEGFELADLQIARTLAGAAKTNPE
jgi:class 3 adenylate cyclase/predicted ATPase